MFQVIRSQAATILRVFAVACVAVCPLLAQTGTVVLQLVDEFGKPIECRLEMFIELEREANLLSQFTNLVGKRIPYGTYRFRLKRPDYASGFITYPGESVPGQVKVDKPEVLAVVRQARIPFGERSDFGFVNGHLQMESIPNTGSASLRVRLMSIDEVLPPIDALVDDAGDFRIYRALYGRYMLVVIRGDQVLAANGVLFRLGTNQMNLLVPVSDPPAIIEVK